MSVPMRIRIRWQRNQWWAYFNGWPNSYFHSKSLSEMCNAIRITFPPGTEAETDYDPAIHVALKP